MSLSDDQVRRLARLARIAILPEESAAVRARLDRVLGLIEEMRAIDTQGIEPMAHALGAGLADGQRLRADAVTEPAGEAVRALHQSLAPAVQDGLYLVPRVIE